MEDIERLLRTGAEHHRAGRFHEAELLYRQTLSLAPQRAEAWHLLGLIAYEARQDAAAEQLIRQAISLQTTNPDFHNSLSTVLQRQGRYDEAVACLEQVLHWQPQSIAAHNNLGEAYKLKGDIRSALARYQAALNLQEDFLVCRSNRLMVMHYDPDIPREALFAEHQRWGELQLRTIQPQRGHSNPPDPARTIRIGYISPDFREHAVARFVAPILHHYDRRQLEVFLYDAHPMDDATSRCFRGWATGWRSIAGLSTADAAAQISRDQIDILVDLAGHTAHHRLDVLAAKPAPIQVTYLGYPDTTGLPTVDYRISDEVLDPPGQPSWSTEKTVPLPGGFCCFEPPSHAPPVSPPPVVTRGRITFGSHHAIPKLNDGVFRLWHQIVSAVPGSRVLFVRSSFRPPVVEQLTRKLTAIGFQSDQIGFHRPIETISYLTPQAEVDISLDCFPYTGHTTTCEALWMGVPVVTLRGDRPAGQASASVLTSVGLERLIADTPDQYVEIATQLAGDVDQLVCGREGLRGQMAQTLCDGPAFCRKLEAVYRHMWRDWCALAHLV